MCESRIEEAGTTKKTATVDWDQSTKLARISYDSTKTNLDEILKKIATAGHDSDRFLAPDNTYASLPGCCKYDRSAKPTEEVTTEVETDPAPIVEESIKEEVSAEKAVDYLASVFSDYFALKDALIQSDPSATSVEAKKLLSSISRVKMSSLSQNEHTVWMNIKESLIADVTIIASNTTIKKQRHIFISLSEKMTELAKSANHDQPIYEQFCPMANDGKGATWLSKENTVKNPYYGSMMLSCGKVTETIK